jgi:hypothetical protein
MGDPARSPESIFRAANERLRDRLEGLAYRGRRPVICECSDKDCFEVLEVAPEDYQEVRTAGHFLVAPGHAQSELERVVEKRDGYDILEKDDEPTA